LWSLTSVTSLVVLVACVALAALSVHTRWRRRRYHAARRAKKGERPLVVAFLHPYADGGGGGERVLWRCVAELYDIDARTHVIIYTGDDPATSSPAATIARAASLFNIPPLPTTPTFVYLKRRHYLEAARYPRFTMLGQSLGSVALSIEALLAATTPRYDADADDADADADVGDVAVPPPDLLIDTTGLAFTHPIAALCGCFVAAYVGSGDCTVCSRVAHFYTAQLSPLTIVSCSCTNENHHCRCTIPQSALTCWSACARDAPITTTTRRSQQRRGSQSRS
jgi:hypothetical protein